MKYLFEIMVSYLFCWLDRLIVTVLLLSTIICLPTYWLLPTNHFLALQNLSQQRAPQATAAICEYALYFHPSLNCKQWIPANLWARLCRFFRILGYRPPQKQYCSSFGFALFCWLAISCSDLLLAEFCSTQPSRQGRTSMLQNRLFGRDPSLQG